jgi:hypothetical protein
LIHKAFIFKIDYSSFTMSRRRQPWTSPGLSRGVVLAEPAALAAARASSPPFLRSPVSPSFSNSPAPSRTRTRFPRPCLPVDFRRPAPRLEAGGRRRLGTLLFICWDQQVRSRSVANKSCPGSDYFFKKWFMQNKDITITRHIHTLI